jgi:hypothetical protein
MQWANGWDVAADNDRWSRREAIEQALHAGAQIAIALPKTRRSSRRP